MGKDRGFLLIAALPLALIAAALVSLSLASTRVDIDQQERREMSTLAYREAEAALATAHAVVKTSDYDATGNLVLRNAMAGPGTGLMNSAGNEARSLWIGERAEVVVSELEPGFFQLDSIARVGGVTAQVRSLVRERDSFARYTMFVNNATINLGGAMTEGRIHSNKSVRFMYGGHSYPTVTASEGFQYIYGANQNNTTLGQGSTDSADPITMPDLGDIEERQVWSDGSLEALLSGADPDNYRVSLEFVGSQYQLTAVHKGNGTVLNSGPLPLPSSGVIYIPTDLDGLEGRVNGRVTLAVTGSVNITGSLQYVDAAGETAYLNGLPTDPSLPYVQNPAYQGNSALGVMASEDVVYDSAVGNQLELNAYFFSRGKFGVPGSSYGVRQTLRSLGGHTVETGVIGAYVNSSGTVLAGFQNRVYAFDRALADNPPPHFLALDEPRFSALRLVEGTGRYGADEPDAWNLNDRPIGAEGVQQ